jgi:predicted transcriptional regulator
VTRDLAEIRIALQMDTAGLARFIGVDRRTVQRYLQDQTSIPEPVWRLLELSLDPSIGRVLHRIAAR